MTVKTLRSKKHAETLTVPALKYWSPSINTPTNPTNRLTAAVSRRELTDFEYSLTLRIKTSPS